MRAEIGSLGCDSIEFVNQLVNNVRQRFVVHTIQVKDFRVSLYVSVVAVLCILLQDTQELGYQINRTQGSVRNGAVFQVVNAFGFHTCSFVQTFLQLHSLIYESLIVNGVINLFNARHDSSSQIAAIRKRCLAHFFVSASVIHVHTARVRRNAVNFNERQREYVGRKLNAVKLLIVCVVLILRFLTAKACVGSSKPEVLFGIKLFCPIKNGLLVNHKTTSLGPLGFVRLRKPILNRTYEVLQFFNVGNFVRIVRVHILFTFSEPFLDPFKNILVRKFSRGKSKVKVAQTKLPVILGTRMNESKPGFSERVVFVKPRREGTIALNVMAKVKIFFCVFFNHNTTLGCNLVKLERQNAVRVFTIPQIRVGMFPLAVLVIHSKNIREVVERLGRCRGGRSFSHSDYPISDVSTLITSLPWQDGSS